MTSTEKIQIRLIYKKSANKYLTWRGVKISDCSSAVVKINIVESLQQNDWPDIYAKIFII